MKLKKLEIKNYRSLKDASIEFGDLTVLIGKNDAGKSNVLKALDLFFNLEKSKDFKEISGGSGGLSELGANAITTDHRLFFNQEPCTISMVAYFELDEGEINEIIPEEEINVLDKDNSSYYSGWENQFEKSHGDKVPKKNGYKKSDLGRTVIVDMQGDDTENKAEFQIKSIEIGTLQLLRASGENRVLEKKEGEEYRYVPVGPSASLYSMILTKIRDKFLVVPAVRALKKERRVGNDPGPDGTSMSSHYFRSEKDTSLRRKRLFNTIKKGVSGLFPRYENIASMEDGKENVDVYFEDLPSESVGEGVKQGFMNIYTLQLHSDKMCGVEEPEIHFHPKKQREIFNYLKEQSKKRQIIITTHSPIFVSNSEGIKTYLVSMDKDTKETNIMPIEERGEFNKIKWEIGARNTDLFFDVCVVLIEGDTEDRAFPIIADAMGHDLIESGIRLVNIRGKDRVKREKIREFLEYLRGSDVIPYVIMDNDDNVKGYVQDLIREGLLKKENYKIWDGEFEECFGEERIIRAMKEIAKENGSKFDISLGELRKKKKELGKPITKTLKHILREKELPYIDKPMLGEKLALMIKKEIKKSPKGRKKTEPEKTIEKIINIVEEGV